MTATRVPYHRLSADEREALHEWCRLHNVVPAHTPVGADIRLDRAMNEWVIPQFSNRDGKHFLRDDETVAGHVLRRAFKGWLPWPTELPAATLNPEADG